MRVLCRFIYKDTILTGVVGDITELDVEAIVNPANSYMLMGGGLAGVLRKRGGKSIEDEARKYAPVPIGEAIITSAGKLKAKYIIHSPTMVNPGGPTNTENVYKATYAALRKACEEKIKTIALPGMGTGVGGLKADEAIISMIRAVIEVLESECLFDEIIFVDIKEDIPQAFCRLFKEVSGAKQIEG